MNLRTWVLAAFGVALSFVSWTSAGEPIKDDVVLSKEAASVRAGAPFKWDLDAIRKAREAEAAKIKYPASAKTSVKTVLSSTELRAKSTDELFELCKSWNPAYASAVAGELGRRGMTVYDKVMAQTKNEEPAIRAASARIIHGLLDKLRNSPADSEYRAYMTKRYPDIIAAITRMVRDKDVQVRRNISGALHGVAGNQRKTKADLAPMVLAAFEQASVEPDAHLCQGFILVVRRFQWQKALPKKGRAALLGKLLLQQPFPRGRGSVVTMIQSLTDEEIQSALPVLLKHFTTLLLRDTMFFPGGQPQAFALIVKYREKQPDIFKKAMAHVDTFNRQPWVRFSGRHSRGLKPYWDALASLGPDAKVALPSLKEIAATEKGEQLEQAKSVIGRIEQ